MKKMILMIILVMATNAIAKTVVVKRGDCLSRIAQRNRVDIKTLIGLNKIENPDLIYAGQMLIIPDVDTTKTVKTINPPIKMESNFTITDFNVASTTGSVSMENDQSDKNTVSLSDSVEIDYFFSFLDQYQERNGYELTMMQKICSPINTKEYSISTEYGEKRTIGVKNAGSPKRDKYHMAIDVVVPIGTPIFTPINGKIKAGENKIAGKYAEVKTVDINGDTIKIMVCHLSKVIKSKMVGAGKKIAFSGNTGNSTGPHVHLAGFKNSVPFDPTPLLKGQIPPEMTNCYINLENITTVSSLEKRVEKIKYVLKQKNKIKKGK